MIGEGVAVHANFFVSSFHVRRLERWFADDQSVNDDAEGPDVDLI